MFLQHDVTMSQDVTLTVHDYCLKTRSQTNASAFEHFLAVQKELTVLPSAFQFHRVHF